MPRGRQTTAWGKIKNKLDKIQSWVSQGDNEKDIYTRLDISHTAFYKCKKDHHELVDALEKGKEELLDSIESKSVYRLALGGIKTVKREYIVVDGEKKLQKEVEEESLPYFPAAQFVLEKKRSKVWGKTAEPTDDKPTPTVIIDVRTNKE